MVATFLIALWRYDWSMSFEESSDTQNGTNGDDVELEELLT